MTALRKLFPVGLLLPLLAGCYSGGYDDYDRWGGGYYYGSHWNRYPYWYDDPIYYHPPGSVPPGEPDSGDRIPSEPGQPGRPMEPVRPPAPSYPVRPPSNIGRPVTRPTPMPMPRRAR